MTHTTARDAIIAANTDRTQVLTAARAFGFAIDSSEDADVLVKNHHGIQTVFSISWTRRAMHDAVVRVNGRKMATIGTAAALNRWLVRTA